MKVIKEVKSRCCAFLWSGSDNTKQANASWEKICAPKTKEGLGLRKIAEQNKTCIARLIWLVISGSNSPGCIGIC